MAITKDKKKEMVADYADRMSSSQAFVLADYRGMTVADLTDLRRKLREDGGTFQIVKNTLFKIALERAEVSVPPEQLEGTIAVGYCREEVPPVAKTLTEFAKKSDALKIKGAILGTDFLSAGEVQNLADLPPREILLAQLLGSVQGPMSSIASTIAAPLRELTQVLQARADQGAESETEAAA